MVQQTLGALSPTVTEITLTRDLPRGHLVTFELVHTGAKSTATIDSDSLLDNDRVAAAPTVGGDDTTDYADAHSFRMVRETPTSNPDHLYVWMNTADNIMYAAT